MSDTPALALKKQCADQNERCIFTSATLFIWLRTLQFLRIVFVIVPIICGTLAGWDLLKVQPEYATLTAFLALAAGLVPAVYAALKLSGDSPIDQRIARSLVV